MTEPLWTSAEAAAATDGMTMHRWQATGVSIDTRTLHPGDLFVALSDVRDGHDFILQAMEKGACAAMVAYIPDDVDETVPLLVVEDVLDALGDLGRAARARTTARVIGVTGSVGKTSAKEMLRTLLARQGRCHAAEASYNNHWGVPLTLARMPRDTEFAVIEIGMNHPGEIAPLARLAAPHVALITTVAAAHLEAFDNIEGIAHEKAAIFEGLEPGGVAVVNADLPTTPILTEAARAAGARIVTFGTSDTADYRLTQVDVGDTATVVQSAHDGQPLLFKVMSQGRHFAMNALGAMATAHAVGGDLALLACDIADWQPPKGRGTRETIRLDPLDDAQTAELIDDAFNANPTSMVAALDVLEASQPGPGGRRIAVLGDMLELGPDADAMHLAIGDLPALRSVDVIHCVGPQMKPLYDALPAEKRGHWTEAAGDLVGRAHTLIRAGDIVLVKGSKGIKVSAIVDAIRKLGHRHAQPGDAPAREGATRAHRGND